MLLHDFIWYFLHEVADVVITGTFVLIEFVNYLYNIHFNNKKKYIGPIKTSISTTAKKKKKKKKGQNNYFHTIVSRQIIDSKWIKKKKRTK